MPTSWSWSLLDGSPASPAASGALTGVATDIDVSTGDFVVSGSDLESDNGLETAVALSLFTGGAGGWWGDALSQEVGDVWGGALYEIMRARPTDDTAQRVREIAAAALAWMFEDKVAASIDCSASFVPLDGASVALRLEVLIRRPTGETRAVRFDYNWAAQELRHAV